MSILDFKYLKPTTITLVVYLTGTVALDWAFPLLPITRIELPEQKRQKQKIDLPHVNIPGAILSMRYKGQTRGIIRSNNPKYFKNAVSIDVATKSKNLSIKLMVQKFQITGATSNEQGIEGANYILDKLNELQNELDYIADNKDKALSTLQVLKEITKGYPIMRAETDSTSVTISTETGTVLPPKEVTDFTIRQINDFSTYESEDFDPRIAKFLYRQCTDFLYHSHFATEIDYILTVRCVATKNIAIESVCTAMVNVNYDLGYNVVRRLFCDAINGVDGFYAQYNNAVQHSVKVQLPYEPPKDRKLRAKKNKQTCHTYIVHQSGLVTQTGPCLELMEGAYIKFNNLVRKIRDETMVPNVPRTIKFVPEYSTNPLMPVIMPIEEEPPTEINNDGEGDGDGDGEGETKNIETEDSYEEDGYIINH